MSIKLVIATQDHQFDPYPEIMEQGCIGMVSRSMGRERVIFQRSYIKSEVGCLPLYDTPEHGDAEHAAIFWRNKVIDHMNTAFRIDLRNSFFHGQHFGLSQCAF